VFGRARHGRALHDQINEHDARLARLDRELAQIAAGSQVDDELARMKGELGSGETKKEIEQ